ncbi:aminotransferase [Bradyrhizobium sp. NP1]|uniref:aminotransferase n=1 Tax=Bradyrhizobium sp. NP1 TaxID=3049772 RepID=UPI0025A646AB|nr:aminotransferase [Bradyrhizobium sp. NP1]WJR79158.1 aminotransferase [Bradyrhizobium sp. NP1]
MPQLSNSLHVRDVASLVHPQTNLRKHVESGPRIFTRGEGIHVYDDAGKKYLEAAAGLWCASLGFGNERLAKVAYNQMRDIGYYHIYRHASHGPAIELAEKLLEIAPVPMSKVVFQCSGSEANDTAVKLVWYYWNAVGKPQKKKIIARMASYHGSTCASVSLTGKPEMHADFNLPFPNFLHTEFPHYYRFAAEGETEEQYSARMAAALEQLILKEGPETIAAFWAEPVMGAGGAVLPPAGYFKRIQDVLRKYDILFVADEVICGFGRTGNMWGSQTFDMQPDMISCAKALSAGLIPISALLINERVFQAMLTESDRQGSFAHGYTYAGHPVAAAVALETLKIYDELGIVDHVRRMEKPFLAGLHSLRDHPLVGSAEGIGLIGGIEIVQDKASRKPFPAEQQIPTKIDAKIRERGVILRLIGNRLAFSPPLIIDEAQIGDMFDRIGDALREFR